MQISIIGTFSLGGETFRGGFCKKEDQTVLMAAWENEKGRIFSPGDMLKLLGIETELFDAWEITFQECKAVCTFPEGGIRFSVSTADWKADIDSLREKEYSRLGLTVHTEQTLELSKLPLVGKFLSDSSLTVHSAGFSWDSEEGVKPSFNGLIRMNGQEIPVIFPELAAQKLSILTEESGQEKIHWIEIHKSFKFLDIERAGIGMDGPKILFSLTAGFHIAMIYAEFIELGIGIPIKRGEKFSVSLGGIYLSFDRPPVKLAGGLMWKDGAYEGIISVNILKVSILGIASVHKQEDGSVSVFAFLMLTVPFASAGVFRLLSIAGGAGFNRRIRIPDVREVPRFPLVSALSGSNPNIRPDSRPGQVLGELSKWVEVREGEQFITAGISFTLFSLIFGNLLVMAEFGNHPRLSLLGEAEISVPPKTASPVAYARLLLAAVMDFTEMTLKIEACLSEDSYLFSKDCRLSGGFAFYSWFGGEKKGDFVITLGGYHRNFRKPGHYPSVDRLGIHWRIGSNLSLSGEAYFALTPVCVMAGGSIRFLFEAGKLKAWLSAELDFLMQWAPFYYDISARVSVGVSYRLDLWFIHHTFTVELGAALHISGPDFGGQVYINWYIISFTIPFGQPGSRPGALDFARFEEQFLLGGRKGGDQAGLDAGYFHMQVEAGLLRKEEESLILDQKVLRLRLAFDIPASQVKYRGRYMPDTPVPLGITPMQIKNINPVLDFSWTAKGREADFDIELIMEPVPPALWGNDGGVLPDPGSTNDPLRAVIGIRLTAKKDEAGINRLPLSGNYDADVFQGGRAAEPSERFGWSSPSAMIKRKAALGDISRILGSGEVLKTRSKIVQELNEVQGFDLPEAVLLKEYADRPGELLTDLPQLTRGYPA